LVDQRMSVWLISPIRIRQFARLALLVIGSAIAAYSLNRLGFNWLRIGTNLPPLNLLSGLAVGLIRLYGWPAWLGVLFALLWQGGEQGMPWVLLWGSAQGVGIMTALADWFLRKTHVHNQMDRVRDVVLFILLGALLPTSLNATIQTVAALLAKVLPFAALKEYWWSFWRADSLGILVVAPAVLMLNQGQPLSLRWLRSHLHRHQIRRLFQGQIWAIGLWTLAVALSGWIALVQYQAALPWLEYLPFFAVAWAITRFGQRGGILTAFVIVMIAVYYTFRGQGLFMERFGNVSTSLTMFQGWCTVMVAIALLVGAALQERQMMAATPWAGTKLMTKNAPAATTQLLDEVANRIRNSLNIAEILQQTVEEVQQLLQADRVAIYQMNDAGQGIVTAESVLGGWPSLVDDQIPAEIVRQTQQLYSQERLRVVNDYNAEVVPDFLRHYYQRYQICASLNMSLVEDGVHFGILAVHHCQSARVWQPEEIDLIQQLVQQIETAVRQGLIYKELQTYASAMEQQVSNRTQQLRENMAELLDLNQARDRLIHAMAHDLRTPSLGMLMVLYRLADQSGDSISLPKSMLHTMLDSTNRQVSLIQALLDEYTESTQDRFEPQLAPFSLHDLSQTVMQNVGPIMQANQGGIENFIPTDLPLVIADGLALQRVLENLITNSLQHNPPGTKLQLSATLVDAMIRCEVADNGIGLTQQQCDRLFQRPYFRAQDDRRLTGMGIGLYFCRQMIELQGGTIGVESQVNEGSKFWFTLPQA
jgi:signal transduction histidine kinase/integral membrane sensor domain MASE1